MENEGSSAAAIVPRRHAVGPRRWAAWGARNAPSWFVRLAPPMIGGLLGSLSGARVAVIRNLRMIHGARAPWIEAWDVLRTFSAFATNLTESLAPGRGLWGQREFRMRGTGAVSALLNEKRGLIFVTAHVGPWDGAAMGLRKEWGVPVMMLMSQEEDPLAERVQDSVREAEEVQVLRLGRSSLDALPALQHLEEGGVLLAQLDRVPKGRPPLWGRLLGQPFAVPRGLFLLAGLARVPLVPVFAARRGGRKVADVGSPVFVPRRPSESELEERAQGMLTQLEAHLLAFPTQWFHFVGKMPKE